MSLPAAPQRMGICGHVYLLIPDGDCDGDNEARMAATESRIAAEQAAAAHPAITKRRTEPHSPQLSASAA